MIKSIKIQNFRSIKDSGINIRPLTIIIGNNSSGKSSLLYSIVALKQTIQNPNPDIVFSGNGIIDLGSYSDFSYKGMLDTPISFEIQFDIKGIKSLLQDGFYSPNDHRILSSMEAEGFKDLSFHVSFLRKKTRYEIYIESVEFRAGSEKIWGRVRPADYGVPMNHFLPRIGWRERKNEICFLFSQKLQNYLKHNVYYVGPLRSRSERYMFSEGNNADSVGIIGENTGAILAGMGRKSQITKSINEDISTLGLSEQISINRIGENIFSVLAGNKKTEHSANIKDVGCGMSQILPILTQINLAARGSMIMFEQPEIHLHPSAVAKLGNVFRKHINLGKTILVETHSEHLLNRIRLLIVKREIKSSDVAIYYAEQDKNEGTIYREITIDECGNYSDWPDGFLSEGEQDLFELVGRRYDLEKNANYSNYAE